MQDTWRQLVFKISEEILQISEVRNNISRHALKTSTYTCRILRKDTLMITHEFKPSHVLPPVSYASDFLGTVYDGGITVNPKSVHLGFTDQSDMSAQNQMSSYVNDLESIDTVSREPNYFWLRDFQAFANGTGEDVELTFADQLDTFLSSGIFRKLYNRDLLCDSDGAIISSRCWININNTTLSDVHSQIKAYGDQVAITSLQPINKMLMKAIGLFSFSRSAGC